MKLSVAPNIQIPLEEFEFKYARSSGPGGQNVNKVNTKARMRWNPSASPSLPEDVRSRFLQRFGSRLTMQGYLVIAGERFRDQKQNAADCLEKLKAMLAEVARPPKTRRATKPTYASKQRRLETKRRTSTKKADRRKFDD